MWEVINMAKVLFLSFLFGYVITFLIVWALMDSHYYYNVPRASKYFIIFFPGLNFLFLLFLSIKTLFKAIKDCVDILLFNKYVDE